MDIVHPMTPVEIVRRTSNAQEAEAELESESPVVQHDTVLKRDTSGRPLEALVNPSPPTFRH
jgi:hypothetical protein